jgi:hypothetical protein
MSDISDHYNIYYNVFLYNPSTTQSIPVNYDVSFAFPLLQKSSDFKISIVKAKFDLTGSSPFPVNNPLDKLLINSNSIGVIGALYEGGGQLLTNNTILDIDYDQQQAGNIVYFVPYIPQMMTLNSDLPLQRLSIQVQYQLENGAQFPLMLGPQKSFSCRLLFSRAF